MHAGDLPKINIFMSTRFLTASVSSRETRDYHTSLRDAAKKDPTADIRIRYNTAEIRGQLKHSSSQTEDPLLCGNKSPREQWTQSELDTRYDSPSSTTELLAVQSTLDLERRRFLEREKLLISQMNALRDQHIYTDGELRLDLDSRMILTVTVTGGSFRDLSVPPSYSRCSLDVRIMESTKRECIVSFSKTKSSSFSCPDFQWDASPLHLSVSRSSGPVVLWLVVVLSPPDSTQKESNFPITVGEWISPPFSVMTGTQRPFHAILDDVGYMNLDVSVH
jgi:hypothetical protein